jgi:hypothetical protein
MARKAAKMATSLSHLDTLSLSSSLVSLGKFRRPLAALLVSPLLHHRGTLPLKEHHWVSTYIHISTRPR